ncbi:hypothetical protein QF034_000313 [Streptomyces africanus]|uniref:Uncharacterized protein n=1 Tax=Streptomyces africanus TaxID=231024 RepID=A0ABU0QHV5_9ACTN|nr:hypothetical protein [Streptomyces africanus]MDQ0746082.1 hypothetical protein [Streptomyces africanus]
MVAFAPRPPDGLPTPGRFTHLHPDDGACLMESAALLAGGRFTDSPPGTHPALAALARVVNDSVGDATRHALWPLAAELADARPADRAYASLLVGSVVDAARVLRPASRRLARHGRACRRLSEKLAHVPAGGLPGRAADLVWWRGPGRRHLEHALRVLCAAPDADLRLARLLREAVAEARDRAAGDGVARGGRVPAAGESHCNR